MRLSSKQVFARVLFVGTALYCQAIAADDSTARRSKTEVAKQIQDYLDSLAAANTLSGAVLVAKDGVAIASKAAGIANRATNAPITMETKFNIGSMNKMFTGIAIAQLAQAGKLRFDDTIDKEFPDYPNKEVAAKVTIHQLLTHTSGMGSYHNEKFRAERTKLTTVAAYLPLFVNEPLAFSPGEKFKYSNSGYMTLGAIIERASGQDYYTYVREKIFDPAGMTNTGFYEPGKQIPNLAIGYTQRDGGGKLTEHVRENTDTLEIRGGPAGGGYATVGDLLKFHIALRDFKLLNREFTELVTTGKVAALEPIGKYAYGFGDKIFDGKRIVGHSGGWPGVAANFEMYPESGYTSALLMNSDPPSMMPVIMQLRKLIPAK